MAETVQTGQPRTPQLVRAASLVNAAQIAHDTEVRQSPNGVSFATFGETGLADLDLDRMLETVPTAITAALKANTYYFVPLALREAVADNAEADAEALLKSEAAAEPTMVASAYTDEFSDAAICHRNVELGHGRRGVFISTRLMGDRFALSFEFFINVAHAFVDQAGTPEVFADLVWKQALGDVRGETSIDAWETRNLAFGRPANAQPEPTPTASRRNRGAGQASRPGSARLPASDAARRNCGPIERGDAKCPVARQRQGPRPCTLRQRSQTQWPSICYRSHSTSTTASSVSASIPLLSPAALAARLRVVAELFPPNPGYDFAVKYRRRA